MSNVVPLTQKSAHAIAQTIADEALLAHRGGTAQAALISQYMTTLVADGLEAQQQRNGRELAIFERDFDRIAIFVDAILAGNYSATAARLAGVAESGIRAWMKSADDGDARYQTIGALIRTAEAIAESDSVRDVRAAGKDPRFWAASATFLERKHPERWARRSEGNDGPKVIVQIGVRDSDVQVRIQSQPEPLTAMADALHSVVDEDLP